MTLDKCGFLLCYRVLNMVAYGCSDYAGGFNDRAYEMLIIRTRGMLPEGETLPEFQFSPDCPGYRYLSGDDVDHAAYEAALRLTGTTEAVALPLMFPRLYREAA